MYGTAAWRRRQHARRSRSCTPSPGTCSGGPRARVSATVADLLPGTADLHAYAALLALADHEPQSQQGLARMCGVSGTTMTTVAETLQAEGLVERIRNPADRRSYALTRTPAGRAAADRWAADVHELEEHLTCALTPRDVTRLRELLVGLIGDELDAAPRRPCSTASASCCCARTSGSTASSSPPSARSTSTRATSARCAPCAPPAPRPRGSSPPCSRSVPRPSYRSWTTWRRAGLVARERDPDDRRAYRLHLRPEATAVVAEAASISRAVVDARLGGPEGRDREDLTRLLRKFLASPVAR